MPYSPGGIICDAIEIEDHNVDRRQGEQWHTYTSKAGSQKVSDEFIAHLDLIEEAATSHTASGQVQ